MGLPASPGPCGDVAGNQSEPPVDSNDRRDTSPCTNSKENGEPMAEPRRKKPFCDFRWLFGGCCFLARAGLPGALLCRGLSRLGMVPVIKKFRALLWATTGVACVQFARLRSGGCKAGLHGVYAMQPVSFHCQSAWVSPWGGLMPTPPNLSWLYHSSLTKEILMQATLDLPCPEAHFCTAPLRQDRVPAPLLT